MENCKVSVQGTKVTIEIDTAAPGYVSDSGKSLVVATSRGFQAIEGLPGFNLSLNCTKRLPKPATK